MNELLDQSLEFSEHKEYDKAIICCDEAVKLSPKNQKCYAYRAYDKYYKGDYAEAKIDFDIAIKLNSSAPTTLFLEQELKLKWETTKVQSRITLNQ